MTKEQNGQQQCVRAPFRPTVFYVYNEVNFFAL